MNRKLPLIFTTVFFSAAFFPCTLPAQLLPNTLLWRVSGKGLQAPSYLYGTMHLTDERIFDLGDSLYNAIDKSDGFAIELNPSEFTPMLIDELKKKTTKKVFIKDILPPVKFEFFSKSLSERFHKDATEITTDDIREEKNKLVQENIANGKMKTFLDIYLFDIARRKGKYTGGLEDPADQINLTDYVSEADIETIASYYDSSKQGKTAFNKWNQELIQAYVSRDLLFIDSVSKISDSAYNDAVLVRRNKKMSFRIDSISHIRSTVFAIGAAHLPGETGLISLLQKRGYTVTPVFSSKKIKASDYKVKEVPPRWIDVKDDDGQYEVSMPGEAGTMEWYGIMKMKLYFDVFSSTLYMAAAMPSPLPKSEMDSITSRLAKDYFGDPSITTQREIVRDNVHGWEYSSIKDDGYSHGYVLFGNNRLYIAIGKSMKKDTSGEKEISKFLHSFEILTPVMASKGRSFLYTNKTKAYQVLIPSQPNSDIGAFNQSADSTITTEFHMATDRATGNYFFFGSTEAAPGYFIENDSTTIDNIRQTQKTKYTSLSVDTIYRNNGYLHFILEGQLAESPMWMKSRFQFRGNRWYGLIAIYDTSKENLAVDTFFNSFQTLNYSIFQWGQRNVSTIFQTWSPSAFSLSPDEEDGESNRVSYSAYDSTRGDTYSVVLENFGKYFWQKDDSTFWNMMVNSYDTEGTVLKKGPVINGSAPGFELQIQEPGSANIKRVRMLLDGDRMATLVTVQQAPEVHNSNNNRFFESFRFQKSHTTTDLFTSKAALLLNDIQSQDSTVVNEAVKYLKFVPFTKEDLPLLHQAILKSYPYNHYELQSEIKIALKNSVILLKDTSSLAFSRSHYSSADDTTKNILLTIMSKFQTKENYEHIKDILLTQTPRVEPDYYFDNSMMDSMALTSEILPDLMPLIKDSVMKGSVIDWTFRLLDSGLVTPKQIESYQNDFLNLSEKSLSELEKDKDAFSYQDYRIQSILARFNNSSSNNMLEKWSGTPNVYLRFNAINLLLQNHQKINPKNIEAIAEDLNTRSEIYDTLSAHGLAQYFPKKYRNQKALAESVAYVAAEDYEPSGIEFITERTMDFNGKSAKFYFFKLSTGDKEEPQYLLAAAGPYSLNSKNLSSGDTFGAYYDDEYFENSKLEKQIELLMNQMKLFPSYKSDLENER